MPLDKAKIVEALKEVYDPCVPVDIVNLGLIYDVGIEVGDVYVKMTTTVCNCPFADFLTTEVQRVIRGLLEREKEIGMDDTSKVHVELVYDPPWSLESVTGEGRRKLGWWM